MPSPDRLRLLLRAAVLSGAALLGLTGWLVYEALRHPGVQARQFGKFGPAVPLWLPFIGFVAIGLALITYVFVRAYRRLRAGEDLYEQRQRRG